MGGVSVSGADGLSPKGPAIIQGLGALLAYQPGAATSHPAATARLLELTHHPSPLADAETEAKFARSSIWYYSLARIEAAGALASLAGVPELWAQVRERFEELLLHDPHPAVRATLVGKLNEVNWSESDAAWQLTTQVAATECNPQVIHFMAPVLRTFMHEDVARLEPLVLQLLDRVDNTAEGMGPLVKLLLILALEHQLPASVTRLREWIGAYANYPTQLQQVILNLRQYIAMGYELPEAEARPLRLRAQELMRQIVAAVEPAVRSWSNDRALTEAEELAHRIFNELAGQLYIVVGHQVPANLWALEAKRQWLAEYAPIISRFTTLGTPATVHHMLDILRKFAAADPAQCFDLFTEAMLRTTGVARYEKEPQGARRFVELVGEYLADYRFLFAEETRRAKLIDCLAVFSDIGWPEARRMFHQLPDMFR